MKNIGRQARGTGRHWYVVHTYSGYEDAVREALQQRIESLGMQDLIFDVVVPKETQIIIKKGQPVTDKGDNWFMFDVALAMQNLVLAAHSLGLGTVHVGLFDAGKAAEVLQLPPGIACVEMTPLGYPSKIGKAPPRKELSEIVFYNRYGQS